MFLTVRGPCKEVADSGAPSCENALYTDAQKMACGMPREGSLLQTACLTHLGRTQGSLRKRQSLDPCPGLCFPNGNLLPSCKSNPVVPVPYHYEAHRECQQILHSVTSIIWYILICTWLICFPMFTKAVERFLTTSWTGRMWTGMVHSYLCCMLLMYASQEPCSGLIAL